MKKYLYIILSLQLFVCTAGAQQKIKARVVDAQSGEPLAGAIVKVVKPAQTLVTDHNGYFELTLPNGDYELQVQYLSYGAKSLSIALPLSEVLLIKLSANTSELKEVNIVSTGYQTLSKERATGSFVLVDSALLNKRIGSNILDRLKGAASGVLFDAATGTSSGLSVRGRSTIFANTDPLIILDNFPFEGNINAINPDDIENISILKDAAAASIWGVRASNGVIVLTSKKGRFNRVPTVSFNSNISLAEKPDLHSTPELATKDFIALEQQLYEFGYYNNAIAIARTYISPVVEALSNKAKGLISTLQAETIIEELKRNDLREELSRYYYRNISEQQHSLNIKGGGNYNTYYISAGFTEKKEELITNNNARTTLNANNTLTLLGDRLELGTGINFSSSRFQAHNGNILNPSYLRPYTRLTNDNGKAQPVPTYKQGWLDTIGGGRLLNWDWVPLEELKNRGNNRRVTNFLVDVSAKYKLLKGLDAVFRYQFSTGETHIINHSYLNSYAVRDLINQFSQINYATNEVVRPIPLGDILELGNNKYSSDQFRIQMNYDRTWGEHHINGVIGAEVKDYNYQSNFSTLYGYDIDLGASASVDHANLYRNLATGGTGRIGGTPTQLGSTDRYVSMFANASYSFKNKYIFSASARRDESNLFGVKANQKGVPLWSVGLSWQISKEAFYTLHWLRELKLRLTNGYNGNIDKTVSAYVTAQSVSGAGGINPFGGRFATLVNPPNASLRWEKINITNIAVDFVLTNNRISGSIEYYYKHGKDIIGNSPLPPSSGITTFRGNSANVSAKGLDLMLNTVNLKARNLTWNTNLILSTNRDKIEVYKAKATALGFRQNYPFNSIFSYRWGGLSAQNGDPLGFYEGSLSTDWSKIITEDKLGESVIYNGPATPTIFGSLRNTLQYRSLMISWNFSYKMGYFFRAPSVNYTQLYSLRSTHQDYNKRWQKTGDEMNTHIPSAVYPANGARDNFYANAAVLVEPGDHIRLQDVQLSYGVNKRLLGLMNHTNLYMNLSNLGLIWAKNGLGIDPEYLSIAGQRSIAFGFKTNF